MKKKKGGCFKKAVLLLVLGSVAIVPLLFCAAYLTVTSSAFLKAVVLPRVGKAVGAEIRADEVSVSLLKSRLALKNLEIENKSGKIAKLENMELSFSLGAYLFSDTIKVKKLVLENAEATLVQSSDGRWNLPAMDERPGAPAPKKAASTKGGVPRLDISDVSVKNLSFTLSMKNPGAQPLDMSLKSFNLKLPALRNGAECNMSLDGRIKLKSGEDINLSSGEIDAKADLYLSEDLYPEMGHALFELKKLTGQVEGVDLGGRRLSLAFDGKKEKDSYVVESLSIKEFAGEEIQSAAGMKGRMTPASDEYEFFVDVARISPQLLRILEECAGGFHLGPASVKYRGHLKYAKKTLGVDGALSVGNIHLRRNNAQAMPPMDLTAEHDLSIDLEDKKLDVRSLAVDVSNKGLKDKVVSIEAPKAFSLKWGEDTGRAEGGNPELAIKINRFNMGLLRAFLPKDGGFAFHGGTADMRLLAEYDLRQNLLKVDGDTHLSDVSFQSGESRFDKVTARKKFSFSLKEFRQITLKPFVLELEKNSTKACTVAAEMAFDLDTFKGTFRAAVANIDNNTLALLPVKPENAASTKETLSKIPPFTMQMKAASKFDLRQKSCAVDHLSAEFTSKGRKAMSADLTKPLLLSWEKKVDPMAIPFTLAIALDSFELVCLNSLLYNTPDIHINDGRVTASVTLDHPANRKLVAFNTDMKVSDMKYTRGGELFGPVGINHKSEFKLEDGRALRSGRAETEIFVNGKSAAKLSDNIEADFSTGVVDTTNRLENLNHNILALLPGETRKSMDIKAMKVTGKADFKQRKPGDFTLAADLVMSGTSARLQKPLDGRLAADADCKAGFIDLRRAELSMLENDQLLADLTLKGRFAHPARSGKSTAELKSSKIDIIALKGIFGESETKKTPAKTTPKPTPGPQGGAEAEPEPTDLGGLDLDADIDLKNILYGKDIKSSYKGRLLVKNGAVTLDPVNLTINDTPAKFRLFMDMNKKGGYPFQAQGGLTGLRLPAIIKTFVKGAYSETKGELKDFALDIKGKGFTSRNLSANLNGTLKADFKDLAIPNQLMENEYVRLLLLPVEVFNQLKGHIPSIKLPSNIQNAMDRTKQFFETDTTINFDTGAVRLETSGGRVNISQCLFQGDFITRLALSGNVGFDKTLAVSSELETSGIILPVDIGGTLDDPKPDMKKLIPLFLQKNALNVLLNTDIKGIIEKPKDSLDKILKGAADTIRDPGAKQEQKSTPSKQSSPKDKLKTEEKKSGDDLSGLLDGILKGVSGDKDQKKR